jgi:hypothetical protein
MGKQPNIELREYSIAIQPTVDRPRDYYVPVVCEAGGCASDAIHRALHHFANNSVWKGWKEDERSEPWKIPGTVEIEILFGSGQLRHPYTTRYEDFEARCKTIGFSATFLRELRAKQPLYQCKIHRNKENTPVILELAISVYETDSIFILVRYDIATHLLQGVVFLKQVDMLSTCPLTFDSLARFLDERRAEMAADPLMLLPTLLSFLQFRSHEPVRWRHSVLRFESWLGVTRRRDHLDHMGYQGPSDRFAFLNAQQASLALEIDDAGASARSILLLLEQVGRLVRVCEGVAPCPSDAEMVTESRAVSARLYVIQVDMSAAHMQTLKGALYNRMGEADNQTMKGIAVIGLVFLPTMLVASMVQAGFSNGQGTNPSIDGWAASQFWSMFLSLCVGLTALVMGLWVAWERYGYRWLEKLRKMEVKNRWQKEGQLYALQYENELRMRQLSKLEAFPPFSDSRHRALCTNRQYCIHNTQSSFYGR